MADDHPYIVIPDREPLRHARCEEARAIAASLVVRLVLTKTSDEARSDAFTGVLAAVTDFAWRTRPSNKTAGQMQAWWNEVGQIYFAQYELEDQERGRE